MGRRLRRLHLEPLVDLAGRSGLRRWMTSGTRVPSLDQELKRELSRMYEGDFEELERSWGIDLGVWRNRSPVPEGSTARRNYDTEGST